MVIGRISEEIEKETNGEIKSGDICINDYHLNLHIPDMHGNELSQMGVEPMEYTCNESNEYYWEVCTAQPRSRRRIEKRRLVWSKNKTVDC